VALGGAPVCWVIPETTLVTGVWIGHLGISYHGILGRGNIYSIRRLPLAAIDCMGCSFLKFRGSELSSSGLAVAIYQVRVDLGGITILGIGADKKGTTIRGQDCLFENTENKLLLFNEKGVRQAQKGEMVMSLTVTGGCSKRWARMWLLESSIIAGEKRGHDYLVW
jgi:hypothetical protein